MSSDFGWEAREILTVTQVNEMFFNISSNPNVELITVDESIDPKEFLRSNEIIAPHDIKDRLFMYTFTKYVKPNYMDKKIVFWKVLVIIPLTKGKKHTILQSKKFYIQIKGEPKNPIEWEKDVVRTIEKDVKDFQNGLRTKTLPSDIDNKVLTNIKDFVCARHKIAGRDSYKNAKDQFKDINDKIKAEIGNIEKVQMIMTQNAFIENFANKIRILINNYKEFIKEKITYEQLIKAYLFVKFYEEQYNIDTKDRKDTLIDFYVSYYKLIENLKNQRQQLKEKKIFPVFLEDLESISIRETLFPLYYNYIHDYNELINKPIKTMEQCKQELIIWMNQNKVGIEQDFDANNYTLTDYHEVIPVSREAKIKENLYIFVRHGLSKQDLLKKNMNDFIDDFIKYYKSGENKKLVIAYMNLMMIFPFEKVEDDQKEYTNPLFNVLDIQFLPSLKKKTEVCGGEKKRKLSAVLSSGSTAESTSEIDSPLNQLLEQSQEIRKITLDIVYKDKTDLLYTNYNVMLKGLKNAINNHDVVNTENKIRELRETMTIDNEDKEIQSVYNNNAGQIFEFNKRYIHSITKKRNSIEDFDVYIAYIKSWLNNSQEKKTAGLDELYDMIEHDNKMEEDSFEQDEKVPTKNIFNTVKEVLGLE